MQIVENMDLTDKSVIEKIKWSSNRHLEDVFERLINTRNESASRSKESMNEKCFCE